MSTNQSATVDMLKQICEAFNRHDLDAIMEFFAVGNALHWQSRSAQRNHQPFRRNTRRAL